LRIFPFYILPILKAVCLIVSIEQAAFFISKFKQKEVNSMVQRRPGAPETAASIDEFYLFLSNLTAVEYVRNFMKRVRKKDSAVILSSQNLEDFNIDGIREYTKPLFSIPAQAFLFNAGNIDKRFYMDTLQLEQSEYNLIRYPQRGVCLYKCGNERYNLMVHAPGHKAKLFGKAGGR